MTPSFAELQEIFKFLIKEPDRIEIQLSKWASVVGSDDELTRYIEGSIELAMMFSSIFEERGIRYHLMATKSPSGDRILDAVVDNMIMSYTKHRVATLDCYRHSGYKFLYYTGNTPSDEFKIMDEFNYSDATVEVDVSKYKMLYESVPYCSRCGEIQLWSPSGMVCANGHGGAPTKYKKWRNQ